MTIIHQKKSFSIYTLESGIITPDCSDFSVEILWYWSPPNTTSVSTKPKHSTRTKIDNWYWVDPLSRGRGGHWLSRTAIDSMEYFYVCTCRWLVMRVISKLFRFKSNQAARKGWHSEHCHSRFGRVPKVAIVVLRIASKSSFRYKRVGLRQQSVSHRFWCGGCPLIKATASKKTSYHPPAPKLSGRKYIWWGLRCRSTVARRGRFCRSLESDGHGDSELKIARRARCDLR